MQWLIVYFLVSYAMAYSVFLGDLVVYFVATVQSSTRTQAKYVSALDVHLCFKILDRYIVVHLINR